jgi:PhnB protein
MATASIYLMFDGNCEEAFLFYQSVFGGMTPYTSRFSDMPPGEAGKILPEDLEKIMHTSLVIGENAVLMGSDAPGEYGRSLVKGSNFSVSIGAASREEADKLHRGLSEGGTITMAMADTFWNSYFGMLTDKFGINWMVSFDSADKK